MDIDKALTEVQALIAFIDGRSSGFSLTSDQDIGNYACATYPALAYLARFCQTVRAVPTAHDQEAEMDEWDEFFVERRKAVRRAHE